MAGTLMMYGQLRRTHPRIGKAAYGRWYEFLTSEDWDGKQVEELVRHDESRGRCETCGGLEHRQTLVGRVLVGANRGTTHVSRSRTCVASPSCGASSISDASA